LKHSARDTFFGGKVIVLIAKEDTAWMPGAGRPPWELPEDAGVNAFI